MESKLDGFSSKSVKKLSERPQIIKFHIKTVYKWTFSHPFILRTLPRAYTRIMRARARICAQIKNSPDFHKSFRRPNLPLFFQISLASFAQSGH